MTRATRIAAMLARHAQEGGDVGDLLAAACREAAVRVYRRTVKELPLWPLDGAELLAGGRPGSWEAEHVRALAGGWEHEPGAPDGPAGARQ